MFFGISEGIGGGGAAISAGTRVGVNLIGWFLITNTQEAPDVGQRGIGSKITGAPVGFAAEGASTKAPAASTADSCLLAAAVEDACVTQREAALTCTSSVFHRLLQGSIAGGLASAPSAAVGFSCKTRQAEQKHSKLLVAG